MRYQGKIIQWSEEDGFGTIQSSQLAEPVSLLMDAIHHGQSKPKVGSEVTFEMVESEQGWQARDLIYVSRKQSMIRPATFEPPAPKKNRTALIVMIFFGLLVLKLLAPKDVDELAVPQSAQESTAGGVGDQPR